MSESVATDTPARQYRIVEQAIGYIRQHARRQPSLAEIAGAVGCSEFHLQRIFKEWAGVSPKRFLQFLTKEHARQLLLDSSDVLHAALDSGLSGAGRLHDLMVSCEAMSPGEIRSRGRGLEVGFGHAQTPFGNALIAWTARGICKLAFCDDDETSRQNELLTLWSGASIDRDDARASALGEKIFAPTRFGNKIRLHLRGTNFQIKVWEALLNIGSARLVSYGDLAQLAGHPRAQRAIGSAVASNQLAYLVPCHRVIRNNGDFGAYHWGSERKLAMHGWETAQTLPENERITL